MDDLLPTLIDTGGKAVSFYLRNRQLFRQETTTRDSTVLTAQTPEPGASCPTCQSREKPSPSEPIPTLSAKAASVPSGCVPCALGHFGTCSGLLNEAMRFARSSEGVSSPEVIDRITMCLDELNTMERVDLREEMIQSLPDWEKSLAVAALTASRQTRHQLEAVRGVDQLSATAAETQTVRRTLGQGWFQGKLAQMSPEDQARVKTRVEELSAITKGA